ncbi:hypothetical protein H9N25_00780 [Pedobacter riviphilus]|uniref:Uncharacterized protein n=1 Tax=Pedobacter riviphilus TaxID=2766984 RepID=A0ABX6TK78_9SPHI|nr:hypothetical protein [Pedobacter riviphilus]QNR85077.1 hypothetical protein H9N25_00780 [Pedobacter riviphilus]
MKYSVTLNQKRFLIVWICIHSFALFVNVASIYGTINEGTQTLGYSNLFTINSYEDDFWPFTKFTETESYIDYSPNIFDEIGKPKRGIWRDKTPSFNGIFTGYNLPEYIFYIILGLGIIFIPKIWNDNKKIMNEK